MRGGWRWVAVPMAAVLAGSVLLPLCSVSARADAPPPSPAAVTPSPKSQRDASMDDYRKHLQALAPIVEACAKARNTKACDPMLVGPDDRVPLGTGARTERRLIRFGWLRVLLSQAQDPDAPSAKTPDGPTAFPSLRGVRPPPRSTSELLKDAQARLGRDLAQANGAAVNSPDHAAEREAMNKVLAGRDFRNLGERSTRETVLERIGNWINQGFEHVANFGSRSAWIARALVWSLLGAICVGLMWGLLQLERRWRVRLVPDGDGPAAGAASARDWQLWLEDARRAAAAGHWREAIHFVYWASISRLESKRLWPADRARTPREYLALLAAEDPRRPGLATLTGSFERTWYGGRAAGENDYRRAEQLASGLISGSGAGGGGSQ